MDTKVVLSTCTGGLWLGRNGVLNGKKATTNRSAKQYFSNMKLQDQRRTVEFGHFERTQIRTAGGARCGKLIVG